MWNKFNNTYLLKVKTTPYSKVSRTLDENRLVWYILSCLKRLQWTGEFQNISREDFINQILITKKYHTQQEWKHWFLIRVKWDSNIDLSFINDIINNNYKLSLNQYIKIEEFKKLNCDNTYLWSKQYFLPNFKIKTRKRIENFSPEQVNKFIYDLIQKEYKISNESFEIFKERTSLSVLKVNKKRQWYGYQYRIDIFIRFSSIEWIKEDFIDMYNWKNSNLFLINK